MELNFLEFRPFLAKPDGKCAPKLIDCAEDTIFYSYNGSCNNPYHSYFGQAMYPFERILPASFSDGKLHRLAHFKNSIKPVYII